MRQTQRTIPWLAFPMLLAAVVSCRSSSGTEPIVLGVNSGGLNFQLTGATLTVVTAALPVADALFVAPVVAVDKVPTATTAATLSVTAAEPFQVVLVQPTGSSSYVRILLPVATQLIAIRVLTDPTSSFFSTSASVAVASGTRTSKTSTLRLQTIAN